MDDDYENPEYGNEYDELSHNLYRGDNSKKNLFSPNSKKRNKSKSKSKDSGAGAGGESPAALEAEEIRRAQLEHQQSSGILIAGQLHYFEYVIVLPREKEEEVDGVLGLKRKAVFRVEGREKLLTRLRAAGLSVTEQDSHDGKATLVEVGATLAALEEWGEQMRLRIRLKPEFGGAYTEFAREFRSMYEGSHDGETVFTSSERQKILLRRITARKHEGGAHLSVGKALKKRYIKAFFSKHNEFDKNELQEKWANTLRAQPLNLVRDYFGEEIAMYFAFIGHYTSWLVVPMILGLVVAMVGYVQATNDSSVVPLFSLFVAIWSTLMTEYWKRRQATLAFRWGVTNYRREEAKRPEFRGKLRKSAVTDQLELFYDRRVRYVKFVISGLIVAMCVGVVIFVLLVLIVRRERLARDAGEIDSLGDVVSNAQFGLLQGIIIVMFDAAFRRIALMLNNWENHENNTDYQNHLIVKTFSFQMTNSFLSLYYLAFVSDIDENRFERVGVQLASIMLARFVVGSAWEFILPWLKKTLTYWWRERQNEARLTDLEKEATLPRYASTFDDYAELMVSFGYVTLFSVTFPLAPLIATVSNVLEIRTDALKLLLNLQRPPSRISNSIGSWQVILEIISIFAVATNVLLMLETSNQLPLLLDSISQRYFDVKFGRVQTLWLMIALEHAIIGLKFFIMAVVPDVPHAVQQGLLRQEYLRAKAFKQPSALRDFGDVGEEDEDEYQ